MEWEKQESDHMIQCIINSNFYKIYLFDIEKNKATEFMFTDLLTPIKEYIPYDNWLIEMAEQMPKEDRVSFFYQMELGRLQYQLKEEDKITLADEVLYQVKKQGRNGVQILRVSEREVLE